MNEREDCIRIMNFWNESVWRWMNEISITFVLVSLVDVMDPFHTCIPTENRIHNSFVPSANNSLFHRMCFNIS